MKRAVVVAAGGAEGSTFGTIPLDRVRIRDPYWVRRAEQARSIELLAQIEHCERTGRIANLESAAGLNDQEFQGRFFNDSDVYKVIEAVGWSLASEKSPELEAWLQSVTDIIEAAQDSDGYLNSYFVGNRAAIRWTDFSLHELYCAGHLIQAAIAVKRAIGEPRLLDVAIRFANHICERFDSSTGDQAFTSGHPEIEMALVELARETGNERYLAQAESFIARRGTGQMQIHGTEFGARYHQDAKPLVKEDEVVGHAVRSMYLNAGATDVVLERPDRHDLRAALDAMWANMTHRKMSLTGGIGARWEIEGFGEDYELPDRSYNETCAAIGALMWDWRMLLLSPNGSIADHMELVLYNAVLSGVSDDSESYFYQNPLTDDGNHRRQEWFDVACCPTNWLRLIFSLGGYLYGQDAQGIWIHHLMASELRDEQDTRTLLTVETDYPRSGSGTLTVGVPGNFKVRVRVPAWAEGATVSSHGATLSTEFDGYVTLEKAWSVGDVISIDFPMPPRTVEANGVANLQGRVAVVRGPIVYCSEASDNGVDTRFLSLTAGSAPSVAGNLEYDSYPSPLLSSEGSLRKPTRTRQLYTKGDEVELHEARSLILRPYATWANGSPGPMTVFHPTDGSTQDMDGRT